MISASVCLSCGVEIDGRCVICDAGGDYMDLAALADEAIISRRDAVESETIRKCSSCGTVGAADKFYGNHADPSGLSTTCKDCDKARRRANKRQRRRDPRASMWDGARKRAYLKTLAFDITLEDIIIPQRCPLLGMRLAQPGSRDYAPYGPSLDRIDSSRGYVRGNVWVISRRANTIKNDASLSELERIVANWQALVVALNRRTALLTEARQGL